MSFVSVFSVPSVAKNSLLSPFANLTVGVQRLRIRGATDGQQDRRVGVVLLPFVEVQQLFAGLGAEELALVVQVRVGGGNESAFDQFAERGRILSLGFAIRHQRCVVCLEELLARGRTGAF